MDWQQRLAKWAGSLFFISGLTGCEPSIHGTFVACPELSQAEYAAYRAQGAANITASVNAAGEVSYSETGGMKHCSSGKGLRKVCYRPNDLIMHYTFADGAERFVLVKAGQRYRFNVHAQPTSCEVAVD